jgi:TolB-like protein/class 3 adenylate cyclase/tetratricopeptide (TPR) repeat protein
MAEERAQRRLAAILAADVVGYSRLIGTDEEGTLTRLRALRAELVDPTVVTHRGRIVKTAGDGILIEFASVVDAVRAALDVQRAMAAQNADIPDENRIEFRIGINLGDVVVEADGDLLGDGVNVAARLEAAAEPGGIYLSRSAHDQVKGKVDTEFTDMGERNLKNIAEPVRIYRVGPGHGAPAAAVMPALALPDKPSIAVLPFKNMSGDPEQEYFADGMADEIITALSRFRGLFVVARTSSFTYKGQTADVKQIGRELGVRYILEGSVRKAGRRVRIVGQLVDASNSVHLWADRFEGSIEDIFDLQDRVTASVVGAISPKLEEAEIDRSKHKPTESLDAYDFFMRGMAGYHQWTRQANGEALMMFTRAIEFDPDFASAYAMAARCYTQQKAGGWPVDRAHAIAETRRLARRAAELSKGDAFALSTAGFALAWVASDVEYGDALIERALLLNPNLAWAWLFSGWAKVWLGEPDVAIERVTRAMRLSPQDPHAMSMQTAAACAHFFSGRYAEAWRWAEMVVQRLPDFGFPICVAAASAALAGKPTEAVEAMGRLRQLMPWLRISNLLELFPIRRSEDLNTFAEGLRKAGLPE